MYFSDEDTDIKAIVSSWLSSQPEHEQDILSGWIEDTFYRAVDWVLKSVSFILITSRVSSMCSLIEMSMIIQWRTRPLTVYLFCPHFWQWFD